MPSSSVIRCGCGLPGMPVETVSDLPPHSSAPISPIKRRSKISLNIRRLSAKRLQKAHPSEWPRLARSESRATPGIWSYNGDAAHGGGARSRAFDMSSCFAFNRRSSAARTLARETGLGCNGQQCNGSNAPMPRGPVPTAWRTAQSLACADRSNTPNSHVLHRRRDARLNPPPFRIVRGSAAAHRRASGRTRASRARRRQPSACGASKRAQPLRTAPARRHGDGGDGRGTPPAQRPDLTGRGARPTALKGRRLDALSHSAHGAYLHEVPDHEAQIGRTPACPAVNCLLSPESTGRHHRHCSQLTRAHARSR